MWLSVIPHYLAVLNKNSNRLITIFFPFRQGTTKDDPNTSTELKKKVGLFTKLKQKVTHPFTRNYISENAEQLKEYVEKLEAELFAMENNLSIKDLAVQ